MVLGVLLVLLGVLWIGQGIGLIGGSFMSGEAVWAVIGVVVVGFGVLLVRRPRPRGE
jgi:hypothetical protein